MTKWALITGASQGIGHELARRFAAEGWRLVLVARDQVKLEEVAAEVTARHQCETQVIACDLAQAGAPQELFAETSRRKIAVSALVNNAGFGFQGAFNDIALPRHLDLIQVNISALVALTHLFSAPMLERREGRILNVASTASFFPGPYLATYYASKAFVYSFSRALAEELAGSGVTVTALCPGLTRTQFQARAGMGSPKGFRMMDAAEVARIGYDAMMAGKPSVVAGWMNRAGVEILRRLPTGIVARIAGRVNRTRHEG